MINFKRISKYAPIAIGVAVAAVLSAYKTRFVGRGDVFNALAIIDTAMVLFPVCGILLSHQIHLGHSLKKSFSNVAIFASLAIATMVACCRSVESSQSLLINDKYFSQRDLVNRAWNGRKNDELSETIKRVLFPKVISSLTSVIILVSGALLASIIPQKIYNYFDRLHQQPDQAAGAVVQARADAEQQPRRSSPRFRGASPAPSARRGLAAVPDNDIIQGRIANTPGIMGSVMRSIERVLGQDSAIKVLNFQDEMLERINSIRRGWVRGHDRRLARGEEDEVAVGAAQGGRRVGVLFNEMRNAGLQDPYWVRREALDNKRRGGGHKR